jgi:hypothetical protein
VQAVTVFVDEAVLGQLPPVCVINGTSTNDRLTLTQDIGSRTGLGVAWLLILAGPLGWLGLLIIASIHRGERLTVTLPYSEDAHTHLRRARRARTQAMLVMGAGVVAAFVALQHGSTDSRLLALALAVVAVVALIKVILESVHVSRATVRLSLDASRRWLTLIGVHGNFVDAVDRNAHTRSDAFRR